MALRFVWYRFAPVSSMFHQVAHSFHFFGPNFHEFGCHFSSYPYFQVMVPNLLKTEPAKELGLWHLLSYSLN